MILLSVTIHFLGCFAYTCARPACVGARSPGCWCYLPSPAQSDQKSGGKASTEIPTPRSDPNSMLAHRQLIEKARKGGIDLYFVGDSIVRRWGCSDSQYAPLLANRNKNFFGWNAGNFGWGADRIENILWRLENGELEGVNPKVIVVLAGTNNVGAQPDGDRTAGDIAKGIQALLRECRAKAPRATIILTALFPRNDNMAAVPVINSINAGLARLADGKSIRFLNVNEKLADQNGRLYVGMMADKLHPTEKGYQVWADALKPLLTELLGPPASANHSPPPTGDPRAASAGQATSLSYSACVPIQNQTKPSGA